MGVIFGILKAVGAIEGDFLTFSGVILATMTACFQTKQYRTLATAYRMSRREKNPSVGFHLAR